MSFTIKAKYLNQNFIKACSLLNKQKMSFKYSFQLKTLVTKLDKGMDHLADEYTKIVKSHCMLDEEGNIKPKTLTEDIKGPDGSIMMKAGEVIPNSYESLGPEADAEMKKEVEELMNSEIEIDYRKLPLEAIENLEFSGEELDLLEPILDIPDEIANNVISIR